MDSDLRRLQRVENELLDKFVEICNKHDLRYYIIGGTLLGAVRHKGFIPWDDDVDVSMPRKDFNKFLKIAPSEIGEGYDIKHRGTPADYRYSFARLSTKKMQIINHSANIPRVEDAWIDIIPLDGLPEGSMSRRIHKMKMLYWRSLNQIAQYDELVDQKRKRSTVETLAVKFFGLRIFRNNMDYRKFLKKLDQVLQKYPYDSCDTIINYVAAYGFKETFARKAFGEGKDYEFEGKMYRGPVDYDYVCKTIYGDYMTLPPESDRNKHNAEIISTDREDEKNA